MATKTRNISLSAELDASIQQRVSSGLYGNVSDVIRAGLRALAREELASNLRRFEEIMAALPEGDPITPAEEQRVERQIKELRTGTPRKARR